MFAVPGGPLLTNTLGKRTVTTDRTKIICTPILEHMQLEILESHLQEQMPRAYNSYPRNSDRHLRRTLLFSGLPPKKKPRIR